MNTKRLSCSVLPWSRPAAPRLLVRGMMGGGTPKVEARSRRPMPMSEVLVANANLQPGQALDARSGALAEMAGQRRSIPASSPMTPSPASTMR